MTKPIDTRTRKWWPGLSALTGLLCASAAAALGQPIAFVQAPAAAHSPADPDIANTILADRYVVGMRVATADLKDIAGTAHIATEGFVCATDPVFSPDGTRLAFSGKRAPDAHLQIWELADGAPPQRIVTCDADCIAPVYGAKGCIIFASLLSDEYEEHGGRRSFSLYGCQPGGTAPTRLTFNPSSDFNPLALPDGRIAYTAWQHVGNHYWPRGNTALMLINADGTGVFPLTGNHRGPWLKHHATILDPDRIAFVRCDRSEGFSAGTLVSTRLNDAFAPYVTLVSSKTYPTTGVAPLPDGGLLLSCRPTDGSSKTFGLFARHGKTMKRLYDDPAYHELFPVIGTPRPRPERRASTVVPGTPYGHLLLLNCYDTDRTDPARLRAAGVSVIRIIEGRPLRPGQPVAPNFGAMPDHEEEPLVHSAGATGYIPSRILGEVRPAADGSVYLKVPADRPLRMQLLDREGFAIANERAWFWVRPNERRVCIGCHENRELSAENLDPQAATQPAADLTNPARWQTVSFHTDIQPILTANCAVADCHMPPTPTAGMNLTANQRNGTKDPPLTDRFGPAYAHLLRRKKNKPFGIGGRRVHPGDARHSPLMWMLYGRELAPQYAPAPFDEPIIEPHPSPEEKLPEATLELFRKWIDLGAPYDSGATTEPPPAQLVTTGKPENERAPQ